MEDADQEEQTLKGLWHTSFSGLPRAQLQRKLVLPIRAKVVEEEEEDDWTSTKFMLPIRAKVVEEEEVDGEGEIL